MGTTSETFAAFCWGLADILNNKSSCSAGQGKVHPRSLLIAVLARAGIPQEPSFKEKTRAVKPLPWIPPPTAIQKTACF